MSHPCLTSGCDGVKMRQQGFTLIELLIALGVMAVFALLAYRGLDSVLRLQSGAQAHEAHAQAIDRVITQLEADLRQASSVLILAGLQGSADVGNTGNNANDVSALRLRVLRRVESTPSEIDWILDKGVLTRVVASNLNTSVQTAALLAQVSNLEWQYFDSQWRAVTLAQILAQPNQQWVLKRGAGLRLTVKGQTLTKLFLVGR